MGYSLAGKVAIVTGASKGLGRALVAALAEQGAKVAALARSRADLDSLIGEVGRDSAAFTCDLRSPEAIVATVAAIERHFGGVDILINNATSCLLNPIDGVSDTDARSEIETNVLAPAILIREVVPHMRQHGEGHIVNVSSESVGHAFPYLSLYVATKAALEGLSTALRVELGRYGIRVGVFRSGYMGESSSSASWTEDNKAAFFQALAETGLDKFAGAPIPVRVQADALVSMLTLPREANVDHMTVRSAG